MQLDHLARFHLSVKLLILNYQAAGLCALMVVYLAHESDEQHKLCIIIIGLSRQRGRYSDIVEA